MKIGFLGLLGLVFITLKLCGVIAWSWWLVLLPLYGGLAIVLGLMAVSVVGLLGIGALSKIANAFKPKRKFGR